MILDDWQKEIIADNENHILLAKGRRIGATHLFAIKAVEWLMTHENKHPTSQIVCSSITEDQAQLIISFALAHALKKYPKNVGTGNEKPTLNRLIMVVNKNKRILLAKPVGTAGASARGFEGQVLMVDEGPFQPDMFWDAATPILATTGGRIWTWGTFNGREGFFWKNYEKAKILKDPKARFRVYEKNTEEVLAERPISADWTEEQREGLRLHLEEEKESMSSQTYAQEYLGIAAIDRKQFYSDEWIEKVCNIDPKQEFLKQGYFFGGFDIARMGGDQFTAEILRKISNRDIRQVDHYAKKRLLTTDNEMLIEEFTRKWKCVQSGIDAGSGTLGVSVLDHLLEKDYMKRRIVAMNNRAVEIDRENGTQRLFNEDMHDNLRAMGERGHIKLFNDQEIKASFRSVQWEIIKDGHGLSRVKISGRFTHIVEGIMRAAKLAADKNINLEISSFPI